MVDNSYDHGELSNSQKGVIITLIEKIGAILAHVTTAKCKSSTVLYMQLLRLEYIQMLGNECW